MRKIATIGMAILLLAPFGSTRAQYRDDADDSRQIDARYPGARPESLAPAPRMLVHTPTASTLAKGDFDVSVLVFGDGGVLAGTSIGLSNRFQLGVIYGAESLLGESSPTWNPRVGFRMKLQLFDEKFKLPAMAVGYDDQGYGAYIETTNRYTIKSKGLYAVISKNFYTLSVATGFHGGINKSFEEDDLDKDPDIFFGWDFHYNHDVSLLVDYSVALNDNAKLSPVGKGRGYLNLGIRWEYSKNLILEAQITNLMKNKKGVDYMGREFRMVYLEQF
jgi:hypothetical protein